MALFNSGGQQCCVSGLFIVLNRFFFPLYLAFSEENTLSRKKNLLSSVGEKKESIRWFSNFYEDRTRSDYERLVLFE